MSQESIVPKAAVPSAAASATSATFSIIHRHLKAEK